MLSQLHVKVTLYLKRIFKQNRKVSITVKHLDIQEEKLQIIIQNANIFHLLVQELGQQMAIPTPQKQFFDFIVSNCKIPRDAPRLQTDTKKAPVEKKKRNSTSDTETSTVHSTDLSTDNKLLIYKIVPKPIWTYGIQLWGSICNTYNITII